MDWMDIKDNIIDVTIGPYEVYEDGLFNYKAAFEAVIAIRNPADSQRLERAEELPAGDGAQPPHSQRVQESSRGTDSPSRR